jgi:DNA-binding NarL/FixJ family response regulator
LGQTNKEIAAALNIAVKTVEVHKAQGMRKLGLQDRSALVRYATLHGWLQEP